MKLKMDSKCCFLFLVFATNLSWAQTGCKVIDQDIAATYTGGCLDGLANGLGKAQGRDRYEGEFLQGKKNGKGTYFWNNGNRYEGEYLNDSKHGKGVFYWNNGIKYEGDFSKGRMKGVGSLIWSNGDRYDGEFLDGKQNGKGIYISKNGDKYEGEYFDGVKQGNGIITVAGVEYSGHFEKNLPKGNFTINYDDGAKYEGEIASYKGETINYRRDGEGTLYIPKTNTKAIDQFLNTGIVKGGYLMISGKWKDNKLIESNFKKIIGNEMVSEMGVTNGYDMEGIRNYCSFVKLIATNLGPQYEDAYINELSLIYARNANLANEFDQRRKRGEFLTWIKKCTKGAKMPKQDFYLIGEVGYKEYSFENKALELTVSLTTESMYIPRDIIDDWYRQLSQLEFTPVAYHSKLRLPNSEKPYLFSLTQFDKSKYINDRSYSIKVFVNEEIAENFLKIAKGKTLPAIVKFKLDGIINLSIREHIPGVFDLSVASLNVADTSGKKVLSYDFEQRKAKRKLSN